MVYLIPLFAVIGPLLLWPIELFLQYPHIIEELFKFALVIAILKTVDKKISAVKLAVVVGVLFALTETVLYTFNIALVGQPQDLLLRFILTSVLHAGTCVLMLLLALYSRWLLFIGLFIAILLHFAFNSLAF